MNENIELEKKYSDIYNACKEAFNEQISVHQFIHTKANIYLSLVALLVGIQYLKFNDIFSSIKKLPCVASSIIIIFYIASIIFFGLSIGFVIKVLKITRFEGYPIQVFTDYNKKEVDQLIFLKSMAEYLEKATKQNREKNEEKAKSLKGSLKCITAGLLLIFAIFLSWVIIEVIGR